MSILYPKSRIVIELQREIPVCRTRFQQGLEQACPNKSTSETRKSWRSEVPDGQKTFKNWKFVATGRFLLSHFHPLCAFLSWKSIALEAKTDELAKHYIRDFGTIQVFAKQSGGTLMDIEVKRMSPTAVEMPA